MSSSVHYVSVKEINIIQYRRQLANTKKQFKQWMALAKQLTYQDERIDQIEALCQELELNSQQLESLNAGNISQLTQKSLAFSHSLQDDMKNLREQMLEEQALARYTQQSQQNTVALLKQLQQQLVIDSPLITEIEKCEGMTQDKMSALLFKVTSEIKAQKEQPSVAQRQLLSQLQAQSEYTQKLWQGGVPQSPFAHQCHQIALMIEKLRLVGNETEAKKSENQFIEIQNLADTPKRQLLADSMIIKMAEVLRINVKRIELMEALARLCAELESFGNAEMTTLSQQTLAVASLATTDQLEVMSTKVKQSITTFEQKRAAELQCKTVLEGLSQLGYVVHENAVNAWLDNGSVVVSHATIPDYGLELGGKQARFQARTVALTQQRDTRRDKDVDAIWCSQHQQLQAILAKSNAELVIERALPAGKNAMKVIETQEGAYQRSMTQIQKPKTFSR
ncbi:hypothetical protein [Proteus hauseri]|uniref:hypothetical protein n=1 Tax=Proteus hauseri TaxID=183417 RepID=UPI0032D9FF0D